MPNYILHAKLRYLEKNLEEDFVQISRVKNELYQLTQPKSPVFSDTKVIEKTEKDKFGQYLEMLEYMHVDERIDLVQSALENCKKMIKNKEVELRKSDEFDDKIYCLWFLDKKNVFEIGEIVNYQKTAVYQAISRVRKNIEVIH